MRVFGCVQFDNVKVTDQINRCSNKFRVVKLILSYEEIHITQTVKNEFVWFQLI